MRSCAKASGGWVLALLTAAGLWSCAGGDSGQPPPTDAAGSDRTIVQQDAAPADRAVQQDAAQVDAPPQQDSAPPDGSHPPGTCLSLLVHEFQVASGASTAGEFVEIAGPPGMSLEGHRIVFRTGQGDTDIGIFEFAAGDAVPTDGFMLIAPAGFTGAAPDKTYTSAAGILEDAGGGLAIRQGALDTGTIIDSVGYGSQTTNAFVKIHPVAAPPAGQSAARTPKCQNGGDNFIDFTIGPPTPGT